MSRRSSIIRRRKFNLSCWGLALRFLLLLLAGAWLSVDEQERLVIVRVKIHGSGLIDFEYPRRRRRRAVAERCRRRANVIYILDPNQYRLRLGIIVR